MFSTIKKVIEWTGRYKYRMYLGFLFSFLTSIFTAVPVIIAAFSVNYILLDLKNEIALPANFAWLTALGIGVSILFRFLFSYLKTAAQDPLGYEVTADERLAVGNVLKRVSLGFFDQHKTGDITATITTQLTFLENMGMKVVDMVVGGYLNTGAIVLFLLFFCPQAALISLIGIILSLVVLKMLNIVSRKVAPVVHKAEGDMTRTTIEYLHGISQIKSYGNEGAALDSIRNAFKNSRDINIYVEKKGAPITLIYSLSLKLPICGIIFLVSLLTIQSEMAMVYSIMMLIFMFSIYSSIENIAGATHVLGIIESNITNLNKLKKIDYIDAGASDLEISNFDIEFSNVSFAYDSADVIKDVSLVIPENSMTAIVGPSGGGKTTLCNLIARFYDVNSGSITVGGHDVRDFTCDSLLKNISMVFQNVYLFHDTIANNILFGNLNATMEDIIEAAKKARCHDFISALSDGYETIVGEGGSTLSGGEKQRVSIARAILKDAPIVMLDEATASIDPENENLIQGAINELTIGKTVITIAHKLSTVMHADNIIVVKDGMIWEQGRHKQLMENDSVYRKFIEIRKASEGWRL